MGKIYQGFLSPSHKVLYAAWPQQSSASDAEQKKSSRFAFELLPIFQLSEFHFDRDFTFVDKNYGVRHMTFASFPVKKIKQQ